MCRMATDAGQVVLPDGRRLDVRVSGPDDGLPLVFHHGTPGAGTPIRALERAARERQLRRLAGGRAQAVQGLRRARKRVACAPDSVPDVDLSSVRGWCAVQRAQRLPVAHVPVPCVTNVHKSFGLDASQPESSSDRFT